MSNLVNFLAYPIRKLFNTPDFKAAVRAVGINKPSLVPYGFMWYPQAGITTGGIKFKYADGVELISYHVKGITQINSSGNGFELYIGSVSFPENPFLFPGSLTGSIQVTVPGDGNFNTINSPLADGATVLLNGLPTTISSVNALLVPYSTNPQQDNSYYYSLILDATIENPNNYNIEGLLAYDYEFLLPNDQGVPTIFQD